MKKWLLILLLVPMMAMAGNDLLPLRELAGTMDRQALEAEITQIEGAASLTEAERLKRIGIAWHNLSVLEVGGASKQADRWLEKAKNAAPMDYEVMVYYGSARTMVGRDSWNVLTKMSTVNKGIAIIDKAVRQAPDNVIVRMVRANNSLALPEMFKRHPKAKEDFGFLHGRLDKLDISAETKAEICFKLGKTFAFKKNRIGEETEPDQGNKTQERTSLGQKLRD